MLLILKLVFWSATLVAEASGAMMDAVEARRKAR